MNQSRCALSLDSIGGPVSLLSPSLRWRQFVDHGHLHSLSLRSRQLVHLSLLLRLSLRSRESVDRFLLLSFSLRSRHLVDLAPLLRLSFRLRQSVGRSHFLTFRFARGNWWTGLTTQLLASLEVTGGPVSLLSLSLSSRQLVVRFFLLSLSFRSRKFVEHFPFSILTQNDPGLP